MQQNSKQFVVFLESIIYNLPSTTVVFVHRIHSVVGSWGLGIRMADEGLHFHFREGD